MEKLPTITILGTGYVGLTTAALFASSGIRTYIVDVNESRLQAVRDGRSFFYEQGLDPLIAKAVAAGTLIPTSSYAESVPQSDIIISAVGTPDNPDGSSNLRYIFAAATEAAKHCKPDVIYVQKSTVPVGTGTRVIDIFARDSKAVAYVSNPEFLRESTAVRDSLWPDRVVAGGTDSAALQEIHAVYKHVEAQRDTIASAAGINIPPDTDCQYVATTLESAELIKVTANAFLALKISFANSIAQLADKAGADVLEVMDAVGADPRIGRAFLNAGRGYGGGCFPKDVSGLIASGLVHGLDMEIMRAAQSVNEQMPGYILEKIQEACGGAVAGKRVAVLGLAFKAGTSDTRRSPGIAMANALVRAGAQVQTYDPQANTEAQETLHAHVRLCDSLDAVLHQAEIVLVTTDWPEFTSLDLQKLSNDMPAGIVVDAVNCFDPSKIVQTGLHYIGVGRQAREKI